MERKNSKSNIKAKSSGQLSINFPNEVPIDSNSKNIKVIDFKNYQKKALLTSIIKNTRSF